MSTSLPYVIFLKNEFCIDGLVQDCSVSIANAALHQLTGILVNKFGVHENKAFHIADN